MRAVAYCRVSTNKEEQLDSLESQQKFFAEYAAKNAYDLVNIYADEGKSGTKIKNRTQLLKLLTDAGTGFFEVVLIKDISRLARNTVDFLTSIRKLKALNIRVIFVNYDQTSSDSSEFMLTMLSAIAQEESANTSKRVRFGKRQNAEQGRVPNLIFGYDKIPGDYFHLKINKEEAAVVNRIFEMYTKMNMGANRIASILTQEGIKTKRKCTWTQTAVCRIVSNEIYIGKVINGKQEIEDFLTGKRINKEENKWMIVNNPELKIISESTFLKAQEIRKKRVNTFPKESSSYKHVLSRLLKCSSCGSTFRRLVRTYKNTYITWVCNGRNSNGIHYCGNTATIDEDKLMDSISGYFMSILHNNSAIVQNTIKEYDRKIKTKNRSKIQEKEYTVCLSKLIREKQKYMDMYTNDIISMEELKDKANRINKDIAKFQSELDVMKEIWNNNITYKNPDFYQHLDTILKDAIISNTTLKKLIDRIEVDINGNIDIFLGVYKG
ncbi:MAG: recombinase family protein [Anaerocolumna sp.]